MKTELANLATATGHYPRAMYLTSPYRVVMSRIDATTLSVLARERRSLTGRDVARLGGAPKTSVARALARLAEHGLVTERDIGGRYKLYSLNREHLAADPVLRLLELSNTLVDRIYQEIASWTVAPLHVSLLSPTTTALGGIRTHMELVLVLAHGVDAFDPTWLRQVTKLSKRVRRWTGNETSLVQVAGEDLDRLRIERPPHVEELEAEAVTVFGPPFGALIGSGGRASGSRPPVPDAYELVAQELRRVLGVAMKR
ncbi:MAG TPA: MarR family transcriptional regulator [Trueperaceae bacterium]|nr:MarR family transcriptional regulator [Trueperaceae bacterium]